MQLLLSQSSAQNYQIRVYIETDVKVNGNGKQYRR